MRKMETNMRIENKIDKNGNKSEVNRNKIEENGNKYEEDCEENVYKGVVSFE